jgi:hypothetical protein
MVKIHPLILISVTIMIGVSFYFIVLPIISPGIFVKDSPEIPVTVYNAPYGKLILKTNISDIPMCMTLYRVTPQVNDMIDYWNWHPVNKTGNVTSEAEAPLIAQKILDKYGGVPEGAKLSRVETEYLEQVNIIGQVTERYPEDTVLNYGRTLGDYSVVNGYIRMELGKNGELLNLKKVWRTVQPAGTIQVIPATAALDKILSGNVLSDRPKCDCDVTVDKVRLAYLENDYNKSQEYLTPIWVFSGSLSQGGTYSYRVLALNTPEPSTTLRSVVHTPPVTTISLNTTPVTVETGNKSY